MPSASPGRGKLNEGRATDERLVHFGDADVLQLLAGDDVHRHGGVECRTIRDARAGHDDLFQRLAFFRGLRLREQQNS